MTSLVSMQRAEWCPVAYERSTGPIVRVRPNEVHVKDSEWMSVLYSGPGEVGQCIPPACSLYAC